MLQKLLKLYKKAPKRVPKIVKTLKRYYIKPTANTVCTRALSHVLNNLQRPELSTFLHILFKFSTTCALQKKTSYYGLWQCNIIEPYRLLGRNLPKTI
jgi:serine acetyltransferase